MIGLAANGNGESNGIIWKWSKRDILFIVGVVGVIWGFYTGNPAVIGAAALIGGFPILSRGDKG